jgi:hypothetical protein
MPKALRTAAGLVLLLAAVGLTTCQALFRSGTPYGGADTKAQQLGPGH